MIKNKKLLVSLIILMMLFTVIPLVQAAENLTMEVDTAGTEVNITGETTSDTYVTLLVTRVSDGAKRYIDQTKSDNGGNYSFDFQLSRGDYSITVSSNGIYRYKNISVSDAETGRVTVRVEGAGETKLPPTEVDIYKNDTTLIEAIESALEQESVSYEKTGDGMITTIDGEEGWQWIVDNSGGMTLPNTLLQGEEEIVLIDDTIIDPVITKLNVSNSNVRVGEAFTVTLQKAVGDDLVPAEGQPVTFDGETKTTNQQGQAIYTPQNNGNFYISSEPTGSLIRPVPVPIYVRQSGGDPGSQGGNDEDDSVDVYIRVEGYEETIIPRTEINVDMFDLDPYLGEATGGSATSSDGWGIDKFTKPTVAHAIVQVLEDNNIDYDFQDYGWSLYMSMIDDEREFDIKGTSGWKYTVNGNVPSYGAQGYKLTGGEEIVWYFDAIMISSLSEIEADKTSVRTGEEVQLTLTDSDGQGVGSAVIYVNDEEYLLNGNSIVTDNNGQAAVSFSQPGRYKVSAERFNNEGYRDIARPLPVIINVTESGVVNHTAPEIMVTGLTDGDTVNESELTFTVSANDNVDGAVLPVVKLNGVEVTGTDGSYTVTLIEGENTIVITAEDTAGNKGNESFSITYDPSMVDDTALEIMVTGLTDGDTVNESELTFSVSVNDNVDGEVVPVVKLNDVEVTGTDGSYTVTLIEGENTVVITAEDTAGNIAEESYSVTYEDRELIQRVREAIAQTSDYYTNNNAPNSDWEAVGLANAGKTIPSSYLESIENWVIEHECYSSKVTDYERIALGVTAAGGDPRNMGGYNLLEKIYNFNDPEKPGRDITFQGINGVIYGLIALDSKGYSVPEDAQYSRDWLINYILENQYVDGSWDLEKSSGKTGNGDVDITAAAITALAPYHNYGGGLVQNAIDKGVEWLSSVQKEDGGFTSWNVKNSESISQTIIALCANGIDPTLDGFTKNGHNAIEALLAFEVGDGTFCHVQENNQGNIGMSTEQAYQGLLAYDKFVKTGKLYLDGKTSIYYFGELNMEDHQAPGITVEGLINESTVNESELTFSVSANDNVDGAVVPVVKLNDVEVTGTDGSYTVILNEGENTVVITAEDTAGNEVEESYSITYDPSMVDDTAPEISVTGLTDGDTVNESELTFTVSANDDLDGAVVPVVKLNDVEVTGTEGSYTVILNEGENTIIVTAEDTAGNIAEESYKITYDEQEGEEFTIERIGDDIFRNGEEAKINIRMSNLKNSDVETTLIVALYSEDNKMISYSFIEKIVKAGEEIILSSGLSIPEQGEYKVKGLVWDNFAWDNSENMKPLIEEPIIVDVSY